MTSHSFHPDDPARDIWDVVVVGTGMGGSTVGHALAQRGHRVLFLERGKFLFGGADRGDGRMLGSEDNGPEGRLKRGWWPEQIEGRVNSASMQFFAPLGSGTGGTTSLYAAQLERFTRSDFSPRANFPDVGDSTLPESWPISYEEFLPYYKRAEALYRVSGTPDPLNPDTDVALREPPPLSERDRDFFESFSELGLHPYRAHVGFDYIPGCMECGGVLCPKSCKSDAGRTCLMPALEQHKASILTECEVLGLDADATNVRGVRCRWQGKELTISGKIVVLAAGAYMSPILLLNSKSAAWPDGLANRSGAVGRNLMLHAGDFVMVRPRRKRSTDGPRKTLAFNDLYFSNGEKLGAFQSVGLPVSRGHVLYFLRSVFEKAPKWKRALVSPFLRIVARISAYHFRNAAIFATLLEDLPYWNNRVVPDPASKNGMRFEYEYTTELRDRNRTFRKRLAAALRPNHRIMVLTKENTPNFGHVCGTCRFGDDPATSVLDRNNRAHDVQNLYIVDASFFPSSGGTNPTLTIAANALRVAEAISRQLSHGESQAPAPRPRSTTRPQAPTISRTPVTARHARRRFTARRAVTSLALGLFSTVAIAWASAHWNQVAFEPLAPLSASPPHHAVAFTLTHWDGFAVERVSLGHSNSSASKPSDPDTARHAIHSSAADLLNTTTKERLWPWWATTPNPEAPGITWAGEVQDASGWPLPALKSQWLIDCTDISAERAAFKPAYHLRGGTQLQPIQHDHPRPESTLRALPLTPVWPGLLINTMLFATFFFALPTASRGVGSLFRKKAIRKIPIAP